MAGRCRCSTGTEGRPCRIVPEHADDDLHAYLLSLGPAELARRLVALAQRDEVALTALRAEASAAAGTFDLAGFRKELTSRLRVSGYVDRRGAGAYARRVDAVLDLLEQLLAAGRAADVVTSAEHVMARLDTAKATLTMAIPSSEVRLAARSSTPRRRTSASAEAPRVAICLALTGSGWF